MERTAIYTVIVSDGDDPINYQVPSFQEAMSDMQTWGMPYWISIVRKSDGVMIAGNLWAKGFAWNHAITAADEQGFAVHSPD